MNKRCRNRRRSIEINRQLPCKQNCIEDVECQNNFSTNLKPLCPKKIHDNFKKKEHSENKTSFDILSHQKMVLEKKKIFDLRKKLERVLNENVDISLKAKTKQSAYIRKQKFRKIIHHERQLKSEDINSNYFLSHFIEDEKLSISGTIPRWKNFECYRRKHKNQQNNEKKIMSKIFGSQGVKFR